MQALKSWKCSENHHILQTLNSLRPLLLILAWLPALLPADALASILRNTFNAPPLPLASVPSANPVAAGEGFAPLTLHLDGLHDRGVLVRQNPWSSFDPEGLYQMMPAAILHANGINTTSHEYQRGVQQGIAQGAKIGLVITVGVGVTVATGGLATAASAAVFGSETVATSLSAAALSGAAGSIAANSTGNVLDGRPMGLGTLRAGTTGALFGATGQVVGNSALAFKQGMAEAAGLAASAKATANTANAMAQANGATRGAAGGVVSGEASGMGMSHNAAGGVTPALDPQVQAAMNSIPNGMRSPFHGGCAEPQMASNLLKTGGRTEGAVSFVGAVRAPGNAANGRPMAPCSSCNEMNGKLGITDMNATHASSGSGRAGGSAGAAATAVEREMRD